jgi:pyridinium-3,5-bisthiocarboxylic acid mononucleotide nickel chelatase
MRIGYFDCFSGCSGDMILGAMVDAGLPIAELQAAIDGLQVPGITLRAESIKRGAFCGTLVRVETEEHGHPHRHLSGIQKILEAAALTPEVRKDALGIFRRLAEAEATAHGVAIEKIHFHEVGALDAIADIVGAAWGIRRLGLEAVHVSPINLGSGFVTGAHGRMPVPAPGTAALLAGFPAYGSEIRAELTTPTGAAVLTSLAAGFGPMPPMTLERVGYGAGQREITEQPNLLRLVIGLSSGSQERDQVAVLEANIDDMNPQFFEPLLDRLLAAGALDAFLAPLLMKKSRPGSLLTVLAEPEQAERLAALILAHSTTFGIRTYRASRWKRRRDFASVATPYGAVRIKRGWEGEQIAILSPEFEDCRRLAEAAGVSVQTVYEAAKRAAHETAADLPRTESPA